MCHSTLQTIQKYYQPSDTRVTHQRGEKDTGGNHLTRMCAHSSISESYEWGFRCIETTRRDYKYKFVYTYIAYIYNLLYNNELCGWNTEQEVKRPRIGRSIETWAIECNYQTWLAEFGNAIHYNTYGYISSTQLYIPLYSTSLLWVLKLIESQLPSVFYLYKK